MCSACAACGTPCDRQGRAREQRQQRAAAHPPIHATCGTRRAIIGDRWPACGFAWAWAAWVATWALAHHS
eukprot:10313573-Alexandrium_andersonii.AAC.1